MSWKVAHFVMFGIVSMACVLKAFVYSFPIQRFEFFTELSCWIEVDGMECQNGVWNPMWWKGESMIWGFSAP